MSVCNGAWNLQALITVQAALSSGEWGEAMSTVGGIDEDTILMLFLIHERTESQQWSPGSSRWSPFFARLDALVCSGEATSYPPCAWSEDERLAWLGKDTEAGEGAAQAAEDLSELHSALFPALSDAHPSFFPAETHSLDAMRWAAVRF